MSPKDDSARDPVGLPAELWAAESPFVGEAVAEEERAPIHPWYQGYTPFAEGRELEEMYAQEAEWESDLAALEAESPFQHTFEQPGVLTADAEMERAEAFEDEFAFEEPGIIRGDNRVRVKKTDGVPWRWICKISIKDNQGRYYSGGTGVLISHRHVLTAAHVVYPEYIDPYNYSVEVIPALNEGDEPFRTYSLSAKPKIPKNYDPKAQDHLDWDYALITLKDRVGEKTFPKLGGGALCYWGHPTCGANTILVRPEPRTLNGKAVLTAGYPNSKGFDPRRGGTQLWYATGFLHSADRRRRKMGITADTTRGQSGSPVWVVENGRYCLVGIAAGASKQSNFVVRVTRELIRQLRAWITEDGEPPSIIETEEALESPALTLSYPEAEHYEPPAAEWSPGPTAQEADEFTSVDYEEDELELLHEQPLEERFDPSAVPTDVADALGKKDWPLALKLAIQAGWRDESRLTNLIFFARHPELSPEKLDPKGPKFRQLNAEWTKIRNSEVRPAIHTASEDVNLKVSGDFVAERDPQFSGETGKKFKELVEWAAREVDINPGLLAAVLLAEFDQRSLYLSSGEVRSFVSGTDDFFAQRRQLRANVPAFSKVRFDPAKKSTDINEHGRAVTTIPFKSGKDAALATAVYLKYAELKLRKAAQKNGGDFDKLPMETRFALVRIAMAAGHGGISPDGDLIRFKKKNNKLVRVKKGKRGGVLIGVASRLSKVLKGEDFLVRKNEPRRDPTNSGHITNRNATILAAQAMHLSEWIFGIPTKPTTQPELETFEDFDQEAEGFYDFEPESDLSETSDGELDEQFYGQALDSEDLDHELDLADEWETSELYEAEEIADLEDDLLELHESESSAYLPEEETATGLSKKLKYLSLLPHVVEVGGKDVTLTPSVMDPGIYDGSEKYKIAPKLQECLMGVVNKREFSHIKVALVDLTKDATKPMFAAFNHKSQVFAASIPKIAAMLAAFQLRHDLRAALKQKGSKTLDELFALMRDDWASIQADPKGKATPFTFGISLRGKLVLVQGEKIGLGEPKAPRLDRVFADVPTGSPVTIEFKGTGESKDRLKAISDEYNLAQQKEQQARKKLLEAKGDPTREKVTRQNLIEAKQKLAEAKHKLDALGFLERLRIMVGGDVPVSNYVTSTVVRDLGYLYLASTLLQSGLYDTNRKGGLWLGADYWGSAWRGALGKGAAQSATAGSLAAFLTLLCQNRLVSPRASEEMRGLLQKVPNMASPGTGSWFWQSLIRLPNGGSLEVLLSKVGLSGGADECAFIKRAVVDKDGKPVVDKDGNPIVLRYVAVGLRAKKGNELESLILELDRCILANNGLTAAQGGHP